MDKPSRSVLTGDVGTTGEVVLGVSLARYTSLTAEDGACIRSALPTAVVAARMQAANAHVKQRPVTFDGASFASGLNGASHPVGITLRAVGATKSSRSPLRDRSTMPSCVIDLD